MKLKNEQRKIGTMSKCTISGCRSLQTVCTDCARVVCVRTFQYPYEWINVKDRLPEMKKHEEFKYFCSDDVLMTDGKTIEIGCLWDNGVGKYFLPNFRDNFDEVTHWMKLPKLPEEK